MQKQKDYEEVQGIWNYICKPASNDKVITQCTNSSFFQISIPEVCFTISTKVIFSNFHSRKTQQYRQNSRQCVLQDVFWILPKLSSLTWGSILKIKGTV